MTDIITFKTETEINECNGGKFLNFSARPLINGIPLIESRYVFDVCYVIGHQADSCSMDIFTCGCGVAGCAGIHNSCMIESNDKTVTWNFPSDPYAESINPELTRDREKLSFTFDRAQYMEGLDNLVLEMRNLETTSKIPLNYEVGYVWSLNELKDSISDRVIENRLRIMEGLDRDRKRTELFGGLKGASIEIKMDQGIVLGIGFENFVHMVCDNSDAMVESIMPEIRSNPEKILSHFSSMTWDAIYELAWVESYGDMEDPYQDKVEALLPTIFPTAKYKITCVDFDAPFN